MELGKFPLSLKADEFLWEARQRVEAFYAAGSGLHYPKYMPSDPVLVWESISYLQRAGWVQGNVFCEWGCGFGIASGLASLRGMRAYGIEIEEELASRSAQLMKDLNLPVEVLQMSYLPEGFKVLEGDPEKDLVLSHERRSPDGLTSTPEYDSLDPQTVALFYAYPWPGEEKMMMDLFSAVASDDAILLLYLGNGEIAAFETVKNGE